MGRFYAGLQQYAVRERLPLKIFSAGRHIERYPGVEEISALHFPVPGFRAIEAYYPLEGQRRDFRRRLQEFAPDVVHLATPEALGILGLATARKQNRLLAGTYHTDLPGFVRELVSHRMQLLLNESGGEDSAVRRLLGSARGVLRNHARWWERHLLEWLCRRLVRRNRHALRQALRQGAEWLGERAQEAVTEACGQVYRRLDLVLARSDVYRGRLIEELGLDPARVKTLRSGVDTAHFHPEATAEDEGLAERLGIDPASRVVLYVGRITAEKNVTLLAEAWRRLCLELRKEDAAVTLVVVGTGKVEPFLTQAGRGVRAVGDRHGRELPAIYRLADVFVTPSLTETLGQVVLEAQAAGTPVLVSDQGAARESVRDGETGLVLPANDPGRWAHALLGLLRDDERRQRMGCAARRHMEDRTIEQSYRHFVDLHGDLVGRIGLSGGPRSVPTVPFVNARPAPGSPDGTATILLDYHAGRKHDRMPKAAALAVALGRAVERDADVWLGGDFLDSRPQQRNRESDLAIWRQEAERSGARLRGGVEGNHDYEFARAGLMEELLGCPLMPSLVHMDERSGVLLTHGHLPEVQGVMDILMTVRGRGALLSNLSHPALNGPLRMSAFQYDVVSLVERCLREHGLRGLEDLWERLHAPRAELCQSLVAQCRRHGLAHPWLEAALEILGTGSSEDTLATLGVAFGAWVVGYGHTHEPRLDRRTVRHPLTGEERTVILANGGSFVSPEHPITWLEMSYPTASLLAYGGDEDRSYILDTVSLDTGEQAAYLDRRSVVA